MTKQEKKIQAIQSEIGELIVELRDLAGDHAEELLKQTMSIAQDYTEQASDYARETSAKVKKYAKENPQQVAGFAAAGAAIIGLVIYLAGRRNRD